MGGQGHSSSFGISDARLKTMLSRPMLTAAASIRVSNMALEDKIAEALERSVPYLPSDARAEVASLLDPAALALIATTLGLWAGSHFVGIGEIADVILLVVGSAMIGLSIVDVAKHLMAFATLSINARTEKELDDAGHHFARAVAIVGITVVISILFYGTGKAFKGKLKFGKKGMPDGGPPPARRGIRFKSTPNMKAGTGTTSMYGDITISSLGSAEERAIARYHELVHSLLSPKFSFLRQFRARFGQSAYNRSAFLKFLEEALAETYAQLRVNGYTALPEGIMFPIKNGYVTLGRLAAEGAAVGSVIIGTAKFYVSYLATDDAGASSDW